jgi:hypothetical protein
VNSKIETYNTLWSLVENDDKKHKVKEIATLFLNAMNDWPTYNQTNLFEFISELKEFYGNPITLKRIDAKKFDGQNAWNIESGSSIAEMIEISKLFHNESDFEKIIELFLNHYNEEFKKVDFIAELKYLTTEQGGRKTPANSGYRPQLKFEFSNSQTSGQQTFIDKDFVNPGEIIKAKIKILSPDLFRNALTEDMEFEFREGAIIIGTGKIEYIINDKLEKASR